MILFFDTETTGLPNYRLPASHDDQPHVVQLACLLTEDDGTERTSMSLIVNPRVVIPAAASAVHGITEDVTERCGISTMAASAIFMRLLNMADLLVAHNLRFDRWLMETASHRGGQGRPQSVRTAPGFCTMEAAAPVINLPPTERMVAAGFTKPKPPRLEECVRHFWNEDLAGAHDALMDVRACARVYFKLKEPGL